jgi:hypothetical protein
MDLAENTCCSYRDHPMLNIANEGFPMFVHLLLLFLMYVNGNNNHRHWTLVGVIDIQLMEVNEVHEMYYLEFVRDHSLIH